jgi:hypothetical protein
MNIQDFAKRADELIALGDQALATTRTNDFGSQWVAEDKFTEYRTAALSFLIGIFGSDHAFPCDFDARVKEPAPSDVKEGLGVLRAARGEVSGGWNVRARTLLSAEIFADFLEMAEYLLENKFKDAAAVMTGGVLEEHLRQLCRKHGVAETFVDAKGKTVPKKADAMNADLTAAQVYNKLDQKNVTAWLDLRNKAAHGDYGAYAAEQVEGMHRAVGEFMARIAP